MIQLIGLFFFNLLFLVTLIGSHPFYEQFNCFENLESANLTKHHFSACKF